VGTRDSGSRLQLGFTLLEVMVALTVTGLALGALFSVIAGNKRLAWRSEAALIKSTQIRSMINFSQLQDERGDITVDFVNRDLLLRDGIELEMNEPERKTAPSLYALRGYEIEDEDGSTVASGSYWIQLDLPE
jgi:prepilin-type N-terminal cleavage/methylation domain-containing protein